MAMVVRIEAQLAGRAQQVQHHAQTRRAGLGSINHDELINARAALPCDLPAPVTGAVLACPVEVETVAEAPARAHAAASGHRDRAEKLGPQPMDARMNERLLRLAELDRLADEA